MFVFLTSGSHRTAGFRARPAHGDALLHVADPLAITRALIADFRAGTASQFVIRRADQHEMRRSPADFRAFHHQPEMSRLDMLAARFQAMTHGSLQTRLMAADALVNA
jgi:hypothetical protein